MFLDIDGNRVFTLDFGSGPKTLLAHSGWVGNFEDWICTLAPISKHWRTVIYDHRGTGETVVPVERITADALVDDVFRVMDALDIDRCILAGFSRGTFTAIQAALRDPSRFDGLILMNGYGGVVDPSIPMPPAVPLNKWPGATHSDRLRWFVDGCTPEPDSEHIRRWAMNILSRATPEAAERILDAIQGRQADWPSILSVLKLPALVIHGRLDPRVTTAAMEYLESVLPDAQLAILDDAGHLPAMSQPARVAKLILDRFGR